MKKILFIGLVVFISGCDASKTYTVDYLVENEDKLNELLDQCKENKQSSLNCENANKAKSIVFSSTGGKQVHQWK